MNVIITGSTGMIGGLILDRCLNRQDVTKITTIVRHPTGLKHDKVTEVVHNDFLDYTAIEQYLRDQDVCFFCVGVYTGQVPTDEFKKITVDYTMAFASALKRNSPNAGFCLLSGAGADATEKSMILFAREKGIAENHLLSLQFPHTYIFRPGYIYPVTPRKEPNFLYKVFRVLYKPLSAIYPDIGLTSVKLADKMIEIGLNGGTKSIYENKDIRA